MGYVEEMREKYPKGTKIRLRHMDGEEHMPEGLRGTVTEVDDIGEIHVDWENGSSLGLFPEWDSFDVDDGRERITVLLVDPFQKPETIEIENTLSVMQDLVEGPIEEVMPFDDPVALVCNEEGKIQRQTLNRALRNEQGEIFDVIAGPFFLAYAPEGTEDFQSLPEDLMKKYKELFAEPERFYLISGKITAVPVREEQKGEREER